MKDQRNNQDIPASVALVALGLLAGAWAYFQAPATVARALAELDVYADAHLMSISVLLFATTIDGVWIYSIFARTLGLNRQGRRLEILTKTGAKDRESKGGFPLVSVGLGCLVFLSLCLLFHLRGLELPSFVPKSAIQPIGIALAADVSVALSIVCSIAERGGFFRRIKERGSRLSEMPAPCNALVLGAVEEISNA